MRRVARVVPTPLRRWVIEAPIGTARYWVCLTLLVSRLAADSAARLKILLVAGHLPFRHRIGVPLRRPARLRLRIGGRRVSWLVASRSDVEVLNEVLIGGEYADLPIEAPEVILDLGSHAGASILFFRTLYPDARIVGVEPDPENMRRLEENTAGLPDVELHPFAVAASDGEIAFYPAEESWLSSSTVSDAAGESITVAALSLDSLLEVLSLSYVDLLKIDIEGAEMEVFEHSRRLGEFGAIVGELHESDAVARTRFYAHLSAFDVTVGGGEGHWTFVALNRSRPRL